MQEHDLLVRQYSEPAIKGHYYLYCSRKQTQACTHTFTRLSPLTTDRPTHNHIHTHAHIHAHIHTHSHTQTRPIPLALRAYGKKSDNTCPAGARASASRSFRREILAKESACVCDFPRIRRRGFPEGCHVIIRPNRRSTIPSRCVHVPELPFTRFSAPLPASPPLPGPPCPLLSEHEIG